MSALYSAGAAKVPCTDRDPLLRRLVLFCQLLSLRPLSELTDLMGALSSHRAADIHRRELHPSDCRCAYLPTMQRHGAVACPHPLLKQVVGQ